LSAELQEQALQVTWKTTEISAAALKTLIKTLLDNKGRIEHGEQSLKKLNIQNRQLESVKITGEDMKTFRRELKRYSVDFSIKRDLSAENYTVFFKGQDVDRVYKGLQKCLNDLDIGKKPMKEVMQEAERKSSERAAERTANQKERSPDRGRDER
jgi:hypothetical protein